MPIVLSHRTEHIVEDAAARLFDKEGALSLEGRVLLAFLESVNFDDLLDDPDLAEFVEVATVKGRYDEAIDEVVEADEADAEEIPVESMEGEDAAAFVDEDDLLGMFEWFVEHMDTETVDGKVLKAAGERLLGAVEEEIVEAATEGDEGAVRLDEAKGNFKRGDFVKIRKGTKKTSLGKTGKDLVTQMMLAMFHKGAIKRSPAKGAYKAPGAKVHSWKRDAAYGEGTPAGKAKVSRYKAAKKGQQLKTKKKVKGGQAADMKAKAKEKAAKLKAKAARLQKKQPGGAKKKSLVAHDTEVRTDRIDESLSLAHSVVLMMPKRETIKG